MDAFRKPTWYEYVTSLHSLLYSPTIYILQAEIFQTTLIFYAGTVSRHTL
jgi:hypothetical protein